MKSSHVELLLGPQLMEVGDLPKHLLPMTFINGKTQIE